MDFSLNKEQLMIQKMVREFAKYEVAPLAMEIDRDARFPWETVRKMADLNFLGLLVPPKYGGAGVDMTSYVICVEELL